MNIAEFQKVNPRTDGLGNFRFDFRKTLQAVAVLLRQRPGQRMNYMRLLKLLYIADRTCLAEISRPITGARVVAMPRGPVLENVYDLIRQTHIQTAEWSRFIHREHFELLLVEDPGCEDLNCFEIEKLEEIEDRYCDEDEFDMVRLTHQFPEWQKNDPGQSSRPIPLGDILEAVGRPDDLDAVNRDAAMLARLDDMLES